MGRGGEKTESTPLVQGGSASKNVAKWTNVLLINGIEYDVTNFLKRHPGGSVIKYGLAESGADATYLYNAFHTRSKKADKMLKSLPQRKPQLEIQPGQLPAEQSKEGEMLRDYAKFEKQLIDEGFMEPSTAHTVYRMVEAVAIFCFGLYLFSLKTPLAIFAGVMVHGLFGGRAGWIQHEGGHGSLVKDIWLGKRIQALFIGFGLGASGDLWNMMHNKHHAATQKVNHDLDLDTTPFVAFFNTAFEKSRFQVGFSRFWVKFQAFTFLPVTSGVFVMLFWLLFLHPRRVIQRTKLDEGFWMIVSHIVRPLLFQYCTGWESLVWCYAVGFWGSMWFSGMYLFGHFSLSHTHLEVVEQNVHKNWIRYAVDHTVDIAPESPIVCWLMGYLNLQTIHHLFPTMPQFKQVEVSRRFAKFCEKHGLNYRVCGYGTAWWNMLSNLHTVGGHYNENGLDQEFIKDKNKKKIN